MLKLEFKKVFLIMCMILLVVSLVSAKDFVIHNATNESQEYFVVNGTTGKIGVGTGTPEEDLEVVGDILLKNNAWLMFRESSGIAKGVLNLNSANDLIFKSVLGQDQIWQDSAGNELMRLTDEGTTGYLGIGTTNPQNKLNVVGDINATTNIYGNAIYQNGNQVLDSSDETSLNVNSSDYWNSLNSFNSSELEQQSDGNLGILDSFINLLIDNRVTQSFVQGLGFYNTTETDAQIVAANTSMKNYVDSQDLSYNTSLANFVEATYLRDDGDSATGDYNFDGGWASGGLTLMNGAIYAQTGYFYNISSLAVNDLEVNGSLIPDVDASFNMGNSSVRWKDIHLSGNVYSNGTIYGNAIYQNGNQVLDTTDNTTIYSYIDAQDVFYNDSMKNYVDAQDVAYNTTMTNFVVATNTSMKNYVDNQDIFFNTSMGAYVNSQDILYNNSISSWVSSNYYLKSNPFVYYNATTLTNNVIRGIGFYNTTETDAQIVSANTSMKSYVDNKDDFYNTSLASFVASTYLRNDGDTATGNYSFDSGTLFIDSTNDRIGIGTISPDDILQINTSTNNRGQTWDNYGGKLTLTLKSKGVAGGYIGIAGANSDFFSTSSAGDMVIRSQSGNLLLGYSSGANALTIDTAGNVGIGTSSPDRLLHIYEASTTAYQRIETGIANYAGTEYKNSAFGWTVGIDSGNDFVINDAVGFGGDNVIEILDSNNDVLINGGNVGIGTNSPGATLHVLGANANYVISEFEAQRDDDVVGIFINNNATTSSGAASGLFFAHNNVAGAKIVSTREENFGESANRTDNLGFYIRKDGTYNEAIHVDSSGNVGIGTSSPQNTLNVIGDINATTNIYGNAIYQNGNQVLDTTDNTTIYSYIDAQDTSYNSSLASWATDTFVDEAGDTMTGDLRIDTGATSTLYFDTAGTGDVSIAATGEDLYIREPEESNKAWAYFDDDNALYLTGTPNLIASGYGTFASYVTVGGGYGSTGTTLQDDGDVFMDGNLGVGTNAPSELLEISGSDAQISLNSTVTNGYPGLRIKELDSNKWGMFYDQAGDDFYLYDYTGSRTVFNVSDNGNMALMQSGGNVGIGTTSPDTILHLKDTTSILKIEDSDYASSEYTYIEQDGQNFTISLADTGGDDFTLQSDGDLIIGQQGNVGIGTSSPSDLLTIEKEQNADTKIVLTNPSTGSFARSFVDISNSNGGLNLLVASSGYTSIPTWANKAIVSADSGLDGLIIATGTGDDMEFHTGGYSAGNPSMIIDSTGNVGIGTSSPDRRLDVNSSDAVVADFNGNSGRAIVNINDLTANGRAELRFAINDVTEWDMGVDGGESNEFRIAPNNDWSSTELGLTIETSGNVGIGTTSPGKVLDLQSTDGLAVRFYNSTTFKAGIEVATTDGQMISTSVVDDLAIRSQSDMLFSTSGNTERMRIDSSGNVGIGTSSPGATLDVVGDGTNWAIEATNTGNGDGLRVTTADATTNNGILWRQGTNTMFNLYSDTGNDAKLELYDSGSTKIKLQTDGDSYFNGGNVGIGTSSPGAELEVNSGSASDNSVIKINVPGTSTADPYVHFFATGEREYRLGIDNSDSNKFKLNTGNNELGTNDLLTIDSDGNVGIGTDSPSDILEVSKISAGGNINLIINNPSSTINTRNAVNFKQLDAGSNVVNSYIQAVLTDTTDSAAGTELRFINIQSGVSTQAMTIDDSGNVGIGTSSPSEALHVNGTGDIKFRVESSDSSNVGIQLIDGTEGSWITQILDGEYRIVDITSSTLERFRIDSDGNVGIGTDSPSRVLTVDNPTTAEVALFTGSSNNGVLIQDSSTNGGIIGYDGTSFNALDIRAVSGAGNQLYLNTDGNVGIGTTNPDHLLHLYGDTPILNLENSNAIAIGEKSQIMFEVSANNYAYIEGGIGGATNEGYLAFMTRNAADYGERVRIDNEGNVGIGTTSPTRGKIEISTSTEGADNGLTIYNGTDSTFRLYRSNNIGYLTRAGSDTAGISIDSSGSVGIGVADASYVLDVYHATTNAVERLRSGDTDAWLLISDNAGSNYIGTRSGDFAILNSSTSELFRVTASGNVGIGDTTPDHNLDVSSATTTSLSVENTADTTFATLFAGTGNPGLVFGDSDSSEPFAIYTNDANDFTSMTELMRITSGGNVGIGTTTPASQLNIDADGWAGSDAIMTFTDNSNVNWSIGSDDSVNGFVFGLGTSLSSDPKVTFLESGNVGIGTTTANRNLVVDSEFQISSSANGFSNTNGLQFFASTENASIWNYESGYLRFGTSGSERMRIAANGNVGIGTSSPASELHVKSSSGAGIITVDTTDTSYSMYKIYRQGSEKWAMYADGANDLNFRYGGSTEIVTFDNNGNVGIGESSPSGMLHTATTGNNWIISENTDHGFATLVALDSTTNNTGIFFDESGDFSIRSQPRANLGAASGETSRLWIEGDTGNVGIGTSSPGHLLDVGGVESGFGDENAGTMSAKSDSNNVAIAIEETSTGGEQWGIGVDSDGDLNFYDSDISNGVAVAFEDGGQVGIGTSSPGAALHVKDSTSGSDSPGTGQLILGLDNPYWTFRQAASGTGLADLAIDRYYSSAYYEVMRLERSTGNVGIGTNNPSNLLDLEQDGNEFISLNRTENANIDDVYAIGISHNGTATYDYLYLGNQGSTNDFVITDDGNIGIGTNVPTGALTIQKDESATTAGGTGSTLTFNGASGAGNPWDIYRDSGVTGDLVFAEVSSGTRDEAMRIELGTGNVGISTSSPDTELEVYGDIRVTGSSGGTSQIIEFYEDDSQKWDLIAYPSTGYGTLNNAFMVRNSTNDIKMTLLQDGDLYVDSTTTFLVDASANRVGIGDASPDYSLDVGGSSAFGTEGTQLLISTDGYLSDVDDLITINDDAKIIGSTPSLTIGDAGAEDTRILFDGNAYDFYMALDDSADDLLIGTGSTVGSNSKLSILNGGQVVVDSYLGLGESPSSIRLNDYGGFISFGPEDWQNGDSSSIYTENPAGGEIMLFNVGSYGNILNLSEDGDVDIKGDIELTGTVIPDNDAGITGTVFFAEESGSLSTSTDSGYQWSFGNGGTGSGRGLSQPTSGTITAISLACEVYGTLGTVKIYNGTTDTGCSVSFSSTDAYSTCSATFAAGDVLQPRTTSVSGTYTDCQVAWWVRYS